MAYVLRVHFPTHFRNATWATYIRCHDDIGWAVTDEDAAALGLSGAAHRAFLSEFYDGTFPGSFARGELFQVNPATGDKRISGSFASLAGLEKALEEGEAEGVDLAVQRMLMGHALIASYGGIPLIYMGDEITLLNDPRYREIPELAHDSRWIHRPFMDWRAVEALHDGRGPGAQVFWGTRHILARRRAVPQLHAGYGTRIVATPTAGVFAFLRLAPTGPLLRLFNFTEAWQHLAEAWVRGLGVSRMHDCLSDQAVGTHHGNIALPPYARVWLI
jgi:amylosucrase